MNITNTILTREAEETTANARYHIEYVVVNDLLTRIQASVHPLSPENGEPDFLGNIVLENGDVICNLSTRAELSRICADFEEFAVLIRASVAAPSSKNATNQVTN